MSSHATHDHGVLVVNAPSHQVPPPGAVLGRHSTTWGYRTVPHIVHAERLGDFSLNQLIQAQTGSHLGHQPQREDRKSTRLNSSHVAISYAVFCLKKKRTPTPAQPADTY